ncbi:MAG: YggS family pyridoxal phosphate-dependent enzyme [Hyphomicrobiaceae bacterium]|nr:YggS family pyridoxal phosphate-dependent enzyme [Hyphomicrobiaceae bacterium]
MVTHDRLDYIRARMHKAIRRFDGPEREVELVAVSKTFGAEDIRPLLEAGQRVFGENRVQEAKAKWPALRADYPGVALHLIGPLQTNKVRDAVALFDVIESVDREKVARALSDEFKRTGRNLPVFVQVNIGREEQKAGIDPDETPAFVKLCRDELGLNVVGLMCIPPADDAPGPFFAQMKQMQVSEGLPFLSMGMSADFETAIEMGATHVRVGSALFGSRT